MAKIKKRKIQRCGCSVYDIESSTSGEKNTIIIHKEDCPKANDIGEVVRLSVFDKKGQLIKTNRLW